MKIKICGMTLEQQILEIDENLDADYLGFIFYRGSERNYCHSSMKLIHKRKVGVFVNENINGIQQKIREHRLDLVQLHGSESPEFCEELMKEADVIKAFGIAAPEDLVQLDDYEGKVSYFLLDTKTEKHGGSGSKFDWSILKKYKNKTPFFLSGGISAEDAVTVRKLGIPQLHGVDVNSRFETSPGIKNIEKIKEFIRELKK